MSGLSLWWIHNIISLLGADKSKEVTFKWTEVRVGMGPSRCFIPGSFCWTPCFLRNMSRSPCFLLQIPQCSCCYESSEAKMTNIIINSKELKSGLFSTVVLHEKQKQCFWFAGEEQASASFQDDAAASSTLHADASIAQRKRVVLSLYLSFGYLGASLTCISTFLCSRKWCMGSFPKLPRYSVLVWASH